MILEPKSEHEVIELSLFFPKWSAIMIFAIIITKSEKHWSGRKMLGKERLDDGMSFFEHLIFNWIVCCWIILGYIVTN